MEACYVLTWLAGSDWAGWMRCKSRLHSALPSKYSGATVCAIKPAALQCTDNAAVHAMADAPVRCSISGQSASILIILESADMKRIGQSTHIRELELACILEGQE